MSQKFVPSLSFDQMQKLITCIYDAALDESEWTNVLNTLALAIHAEQGHMRLLCTQLNNVRQVYTLNKDADWTQAYNDYYIHMDPWIKFVDPYETTLDCTHNRLTDKEFEATEFYNDFLTTQDVHYGVGGNININDDSTCYVTFQRAKKNKGFEVQHLDVIKSLVPHIKKAVLINEKMRSVEFKHNLVSNTLDQINSPICLVNQYGRVLFINRLAEQLIKVHDGIFIKNNCIYINALHENNKLQNLIQQATGKNNKDFSAQGGAMYYKNPVSHSSLSILVSPINPEKTNLDTANDEVALILFNTNDHKVTLSTELLSGMYNLSPAEAKLTFHLCQGLTLDEISENFLAVKTRCDLNYVPAFIKWAFPDKLNLYIWLIQGQWNY